MAVSHSAPLRARSKRRECTAVAGRERKGVAGTLRGFEMRIEPVPLQSIGVPPDRELDAVVSAR